MSESLEVPDGAAHRVRLRACMRLMEWVADNARHITSPNALGPADLIIISIFARSTRTYEAVVRHLGEKAFGEQGLMLTRTLWEDMVDVHWVALNEDLAVERLEQHDLFSRLLRADIQREFPEMFDHRAPPKIKVSNEERKELIQLFGRRGSNSWTGPISTPDRLESVLSFWKTDEGQADVLFWQAWVVKMLNETVHPSALSIGRMGSPSRTPETLEWRFGSTPEWLTQALHAAWWTYQQTLGLLVERYSPAMADELAEQVLTITREFRQAHQWEMTGRLGPLSPDEGLGPDGGASPTPS